MILILNLTLRESHILAGWERLESNVHFVVILDYHILCIMQNISVIIEDD